MKSNMKPSCVRLLLLIPVVANFSLASIETETKYTIITSPSKTPLSTNEHLDVLTPGITQESTPVTNIEDAVSINVIQNDVMFDVPRDHNQLKINEQQSDETNTLNITTARSTPNGKTTTETVNDNQSKLIKKKKKQSKAPTITNGPSNITAYYGDRIELLCKSDGRPKPKISWTSRRIGNMPKVGPSYRVHKNGSLIFRRIEKQHESIYTCRAENLLGFVTSSPARVSVEAKVQIVQYPEVVREAPGTPKDMQCTATGDPPPLISWLKDGTPLPLASWKSQIYDGVEYKPFDQYSRSVLRINVTDTANYTCFAMNQMIGGRQSADTKSFMVYVKTEDEKNTQIKAGNEVQQRKPSKGYCAPYNGQICKKYLQGRGLVWFNISKDNSGGWMNEQITQSLWDELIKKLHEPCRSAAEALLCKYAFPDCVLNEGVAVGLPLCQQDCIALKHHFCYKDWALIEDNKRRGIFIDSRGHFRLPKCDILPAHDNSTTNNKACTRSSITAMRWDLATTNCVKGSGRYYHGYVNKTQSGIPCAAWFSKEPHEQSSPPNNIFPEMRNSQNHCRNPGGTESSPWCYTTDVSVRWQYCDIPKCENLTEHVNYAVEVEVFGGSSQDFMQEMMSPTFIVLASCIAFATLVVVLLLGLICNRLCRSKAQNNGYTAANLQENAIDLDKLPQNANYHQSGAQLNPKLEQLEYPRNDIIYIRDVGQGAFGRVFQAKAPNLVPGEEFTMIAVKMLKDDATEDVLKDFEREACMLSEFDHPHIVRLLGVCAIGKPMCLLFEYMSRGDLSLYLRACSPNSYLTEKSSIAATTNASSGGGVSCNGFGGDVKISHIEQVQIAKQVCSGMVYLSDRKFVHRDLASRNCLLDSNGSCKIADFGLSQRVYSSHGGNAYYRGDEEDAIPIRWMPPEAVLQNKYTVESDVWAFGVLLWEIFSMALQPYYGLSHEEVVKYVKSGKVLQCPENTPKSIYSIMVKCWNLRPFERPAFRSLHRELETIGRELILIQKHYRSQKSILSESLVGGRMTPQSPAKSSYA